MNTAEMIELFPIPEDSKALLRKAIATRGKNKGYLLSDAPGDNIGWQVLISYVAPARVKVWGLMMRGDCADAYNKLDKELYRLGCVNHALNSVEPAYRWNLSAHRYNLDKLREITIEHLEKLSKEAA